MSRKLNFKQGKYIFPLVILLPLAGLVYTVGNIFTSDRLPVEEDSSVGLKDRLPDSKAEKLASKYEEMRRRYSDEDVSYTGMEGFEHESYEKERLDNTYTQEQLDSILAAQQELDKLQRVQEDLQRQINGSARKAEGGDQYYYDEYGNPIALRDHTPGARYPWESDAEYIRRVTEERREQVRKAMGLDEEEEEVVETTEVVEEPEEEAPALVVKKDITSSGSFNTVSQTSELDDAPLIKAMIDKTTKAKDGTRLRFKLLDDVIVKDVTLPRGTYLYGTVSGFKQQRVMVKVTSILTGSKFLKVDLSVFDNDGMEGFYVPESEFRDFVNDAGSQAIRSNVNINSGSYGTGINVEAIALQAMQNVYNAATNAVANKLKRNKAKIKYNTIIYLINSNDSK